MAGLSLRLFGGFELSSASGATIQMAARKPALLLAYLALMPGQRHSREKLSTLFWGDNSDFHARKSLSQALSVLREHLGPHGGMPVTAEAEITVSPDLLITDVAEFERDIRRGGPDALQNAVGLYKGELLDGYRPREPLLAEWLTAERQRLREQALAAMAALLDHVVAAGSIDSGIRLALRIVVLDPLQESAHRALMRLYAQQGRRGAALTQYETCREILERELGVAPEDTTHQLYKELRDKRGVPSAEDAPGGSRLPVPTTRRLADTNTPKVVGAPQASPQGTQTSEAQGSGRELRAAERLDAHSISPLKPVAGRRLAAILASDVVAFSRLMERDEVGTVARFKELRQAVFDPNLERYGGRIVDLKGDGAMVEFQSVVAAVEAAVAIQRDTTRYQAEWPADAHMQFRIGITSGDVIVDGEEVFGECLNVAARIQSLCEPAGVWLSEGVYDQIRGKLAIRCEPSGRHHVKNISVPIETWRVLLGVGETKPPLAPERRVAADPKRGHIADPRPAAAERRQLTVLHCNLTGSTDFASQLDPEDLHRILGTYQEAIAGEVARFEGHVAKLMGDNVLACFGWPKAQEDAAERAVRAGLRIVAEVQRLADCHGMPFAAQVGIATDIVVIGDLAGLAEKGAVIGAAPNLAARLRELAEPGTVVIAEATRRLLGEVFELKDLGTRVIHGLSTPLRAYRINGDRAGVSRFEAHHRAAPTPMVGRDQELALLLERWRLTREGEGQAVMLVGEAGIGKSRLVRAVLDTLAAEENVTLRYQCSPYHTGSALWPVVQQIGLAAGFSPGDTASDRPNKLEALLRRWGQDVGTTGPLWAVLLGIDTGGRYAALDLAPQEWRARTLASLVEQLLRIAQRHPVLMVVEDSHWIDPTTLEFLDLALDRIANARVLMLVSSRPDSQPALSAHLHVTQLTLSRLARESALAIIAGVAAGATLPAKLREEIGARTDGVPLFIEELTKAILEAHAERRNCDRNVLPATLPPLAIPSTLHDSLTARLDHLGPAKELAQIAAVIGREFDRELLASIADIPEQQLLRGLESLVTSQMVFRREASPTIIYSFKHALIRDAAYESLLRSRRRRIHVRIVEVLKARSSGPAEAQPEVLAQHCTHAGLTDQAVAWRLKAGRRAIERSAMREAAAHLTKGLEALQDLPNSPERDQLEFDLQIALGNALQSAMGSAAGETGAAYARARTLATLLNAKRELFVATEGEFRFYFNRAELKTARQIANHLSQLGDEMGEINARLLGLKSAGLVAFSSGELLTAKALLEKVLSAESRHQDGNFTNEAGVASMIYLCWTLLLLGFPQDAQQICGQALERGENAKQPYTLAVALANSCTFYHLCRDWSALKRNCEHLIDLATERFMPGWLETGLAFRGLTLVQQGQLVEGIRLIKYSLSEATRTNFVLEQPYFLSHLAEGHNKADNFSEALQAIDAALGRVASTGERWFEAELYRLKGEFALRAPTPDEAFAHDCLRRALGIAKEQSGKWWELRSAISLARFDAEHGRRSDAHSLLAPIYNSFTEGFETPDLRDARALLDELS